MAAREDLANVVIWFSDVLVRHAQVRGRQLIGPPGWMPLADPPNRTRQQALARALEARDRARQPGAVFAGVARTYSDDAVTREQGGSVGGVPALELLSWPEFLDAFAVLKPGDTSEVIETSEGFHVLYRRPPPGAAQISGRRIVVGYREAPWLVRRKGHEAPARSHDEAMARAREVLGKVTPGGANFRELVDAYSEHGDAEQGGDLGVWSNHEPTNFTREIEILGTLAVGQTSDLVDTASGVEILMRTMVDERPTYAAAAVKVRFDPDAAEANEQSKTNALVRARSIASVLHGDPSRFLDFQREYCCKDAERWTRGRGPLGATSLLDGLQVGEIAEAPMEIEPYFVIWKRLSAKDVAPPPDPVFELPAPSVPNLEILVSGGKPQALAQYVHTLQATGVELLQLKGERQKRFAQVHDLLAQRLATSHQDARISALREALGELRTVLAANEFEEYIDFVNKRVGNLVMGSQSPRAF